MTDRGHDASPPVPAVLPVGPPGDDPEGWLRESARRLVALDGRTGGEQVADLAARTVALARQYRMVVGAQLLVARLALRDWVDAGRVADRLLGSTTTGSARTGRVLRHAVRLAVAGAPSSLGDRVVALARRYPVHVVERS